MPVPPQEYTPSLSHSPSACFTSLALGFNNRSDQNSQSSVVATGPLPGEFTSTTHSLTWREFLTGLTTCLFNHNHLSHLERVFHTGLKTCFFNFVPAQGGQQQQVNTVQENQKATNHTQPRDCVATTTHSYNTHDIGKHKMLKLPRRRRSVHGSPWVLDA
jgi:hypothetical protein